VKFGRLRRPKDKWLFHVWNIDPIQIQAILRKTDSLRRGNIQERKGKRRKLRK
jgi:hypothetical protein